MENQKDLASPKPGWQVRKSRGGRSGNAAGGAGSEKFMKRRSMLGRMQEDSDSSCSFTRQSSEEHPISPPLNLPGPLEGVRPSGIGRYRTDEVGGGPRVLETQSMSSMDSFDYEEYGQYVHEDFHFQNSLSEIPGSSMSLAMDSDQTIYNQESRESDQPSRNSYPTTQETRSSIPKNFICPYPDCETTFNRKDHLKRHQKIHQGDKVICDHEGCSKLCRDNSDLKRHKLLKHGLDGRFQCEHCQESFVKRSLLLRHQRQVHQSLISSKGSFKCEVCSESFSHLHLLEGHMVIHSGQKLYQCPSCKKDFAYKHNLAAHTKKSCSTVESDKKKAFQCNEPECAKMYTDIRSLQRHVKKDHCNKRFLCYKCKATFSYQSGLSRHGKTCKSTVQ